MYGQITNGADLATALAEALSTIPGLRVHAYAPDGFRPPGVVVQQPSMSWEPGNRTFDSITWTFPLLLAVPRTTDREAHAALYRFIGEIAAVLSDAAYSGWTGWNVQTARLLSATPATVTASGSDFPGYSLTVEVIA